MIQIKLRGERNGKERASHSRRLVAVRAQVPFLKDAKPADLPIKQQTVFEPILATRQQKSNPLARCRPD